MTESGQTRVHDLTEFRAWVGNFAGLLKGNEILILSGEMAAGKTEFAKTLGALWGANGVASPTFALHASFQARRGVLDHFDLYRVKDVDELETVGLWDVLQDSSLVLIEWPERVPENFWPRHRTRYEIRIEKISDHVRDLSWKKV